MSKLTLQTKTGKCVKITGRRFAELEMKLLLVKVSVPPPSPFSLPPIFFFYFCYYQIVNQFRLSTPMEQLNVVEKAVMTPDGDLPIKFTDR